MLKVNNITVSYSDIPVLQDISFTLDEGKIVSVVGESGSGKSTLLKAIYGLLPLTEGALSWKDKKMLGPLYNLIPGEPFIKYVSQDFELMPFITVSENIGKYLSAFYPEQKKERIKQLLKLINLSEFANTLAKDLSGGQQQRIALARALAQAPELLLLDEPFSQVDSFRKNSLRHQLFSYLRKKNISCIIATHDAVDALSYADEVIILKAGKIIASGAPQEIYNNPNSIYVASLFDEVNVLPASIFNIASNPQKNVLLYPHELTISNNENGLKTRIVNIYYRGSYFLIEGLHHGNTVLFKCNNQLNPGQWVWLKQPELSLLESRLVN